MKWRTAKVDQIRADSRNSLVGGPFGSDLTTRDYVEEGIPVIRGANLSDTQCFCEDHFVFVTEQKADQLSANNALRGDLVFTQRGTLGQVALIPQNSRFPRYLISQSQMKLTVNAELADAKFVYYFFRHPSTIEAVKNRAITSGVPHINLGILREFRLPLPETRIQRRIASILSAYDDLIENNLRRMGLLEEAARLLYREWFVHLRFPGHEHIPITKGIPKGWERAPLQEALALQRGYDLTQRQREEGAVPVYGSTGRYGFHGVAKAKGPGVVTGRSGTLGEVHYVEEDFWPHNTALFVTRFKRVTPLYALLLLREMRLEQYNGGVSVPTLDRKAVHRVPIVIPRRRFVGLFEEHAGPIFQQIGILCRQNRKLRTACDLLLPKLMSGEIEV